jgi:hypothetical protein
MSSSMNIILLLLFSIHIPALLCIPTHQTTFITKEGGKIKTTHSLTHSLTHSIYSPPTTPSNLRLSIYLSIYLPI